MNAEEIINLVISLPGVGSQYYNAVNADLNGLMKRVLMRYPWKFNMKEGSHTTTTANEYTLTGGSDNDAEDVGIIDSIKYDSDYEYLEYITPRLYDLKKSSEYGYGDINYYTIRKTSGQRFPIVEFLGSITSGKTFYYYYRKRAESDVASLFPDEFFDVFANKLVAKWATDPMRQQSFLNEYSRALNDMKRVWIDMSVIPPQTQTLPKIMMERARWANRKYSS